MKKLRDEIEFKSEGGLFDLIDNHVKGAYNITDTEYDYITTTATDEELSSFVDAIALSGDNGSTPFSLIRKGFEIRNKYLTEFYKL